MNIRKCLLAFRSEKLMPVLFLLFVAFLISRTWFLLGTMDNFAQLRFLDYSDKWLRPDASLPNEALLNPEYSRILFPNMFRIISVFLGSPLIAFEILRFIFIFALLLSQYHLALRFLNSSQAKALLSSMLLAILLLIIYRPGSPRGDAINDMLDIMIYCLIGIIALNQRIKIRHFVIACFLQVFISLNRGEPGLLLPIAFFILGLIAQDQTRSQIYYKGVITVLLLGVGFVCIAFARQLNIGSVIDVNMQTKLPAIQRFNLRVRTVGDIISVWQQLFLFFKGAPFNLALFSDEIWVARNFGVYNIWFSYFWVFVPLLFVPSLFIRRLKRPSRFLIVLTWTLLIISWFGTQMDEIRAVSFIFPFCAIIPFAIWNELSSERR